MGIQTKRNRYELRGAQPIALGDAAIVYARKEFESSGLGVRDGRGVLTIRSHVMMMVMRVVLVRSYSSGPRVEFSGRRRNAEYVQSQSRPVMATY